MGSAMASLGNKLAGATGAVEGAMGGDTAIIYLDRYAAPRSGDEERGGGWVRRGV